jgi:hypothetical protein
MVDAGDTNNGREAILFDCPLTRNQAARIDLILKQKYASRKWRIRLRNKCTLGLWPPPLAAAGAPGGQRRRPGRHAE